MLPPCAHLVCAPADVALSLGGLLLADVGALLAFHLARDRLAELGAPALPCRFRRDQCQQSQRGCIHAPFEAWANGDPQALESVGS